MQFARQHAKVRDFTSRHACLEVKFGFRQVQVCFIGGSLPVILSSMVRISATDPAIFHSNLNIYFISYFHKNTLTSRLFYDRKSVQ